MREKLIKRLRENYSAVKPRCVYCKSMTFELECLTQLMVLHSIHSDAQFNNNTQECFKFSYFDYERLESSFMSIFKIALQIVLSNLSETYIDEDLTARINMADYIFSFHEKGKCFSPAWMAPEALQKTGEDLNQRAADMWSFAILLWELETREVPFAELSPMEIGMKIALEGLRIKVPPGISSHMSRLIKICMNEEAGKRPRFDMVIPILDKMKTSG